MNATISVIYNSKLLNYYTPSQYTFLNNFIDHSNRVILEDRRIRMNAWVAKLINKSIEKFSNPKLIDPTITHKER